MGQAGPSAHEHARADVLSPISLDGADVMDLPWPPLSSPTQCNHTAIPHRRVDSMPTCCQHLPLKNWWDKRTHAEGETGWGKTRAEREKNWETKKRWEHMKKKCLYRKANEEKLSYELNGLIHFEKHSNYKRF